jgi:hypothetical protein
LQLLLACITKRPTFNVPDGSSELNDADLRLVVAHGCDRHALHPVLDGVGDVWDDLKPSLIGTLLILET